ncbi:MAG TPA: hypothetical protein VNV25_25640 [Gemmatimonadaceae bacterium]|jgi:hypothetical protein|nr:hypothetical protein [Gemmatimonadaceae bacterium]
MASKKRKKAKKKTGRKGRRGASRKTEKKTRKRKARKSSKRSRAARKAARTRMAKKEARRAAARKAARSRKRKGGGKRKARKSGKRKSAKRSAAARKGARTRKARKSGKTRRRARRASPERIYKKALVEGNRHERAASRLRTQYEKALKANKNRSAAQVEKLRKQQERLKARLQYHEGMAAEARKRKGKRRGGKRRERNPIGSGGMQEYAAVGGGVLTAIALTIGPYRMIRSHALGSGGGQGNVDAPVQGDVPNLLTGQLPLWSRLKWKGAIALGVVLVGDIALPLFVASRIKTSDGWKTFFQLWGWTSVALASTKLVVDTLALATKSTSLGQRLFAPENTARDVRTMSAATKLPPITVAPGVGLPGLTGYGSPPPDPKRHTGAAGCGCSACEAQRKQANPNQPGTHQPITGTTPMPAQPGAVQPPGGNPLNSNTVVTGLPGNGVTAPTGAGSVTPINKFAPKPRFDGKSRFGTR